jgi:outer membrane protein
MISILWLGPLLTMSMVVQAEDLMQIYRKALLNDPEILGAQYARAAANESAEEAVGKMYPQVAFEYSRASIEQEITDSDNPFQPEDEDDYPTEDYSLTLTQPLYNRALYTGYQQAKTDIQRADAEFASKQQDLILRAAQAYLEVLAASDEVGFTGAEKLAVGKQLELVQSMMISGMARKTELYDARARYASVEADEIGATSTLDDKLQALREMVGELEGDLLTLKTELDLVKPDPLDPESWMQAAVEQNPRVLLQLKTVQVSRYEVMLQKAGHMPTVDLTARYNESDSEGSLFGGGNEVETSNVMLRLNVPIYQGGIVNSRTRRSQQLHQKAMQDLTAIQRSVQRAARAAYYGIISAISKVNALDKSVSAQQLALQSKQQGNRSGLYTSLDVIDAERDVYEAKRNYARARYEYLLNTLRLKHAVGTLSEADVESINVWLRPGG